MNWKGIGAALVSVAGVAASPALLNILPPQWAAAVSGVGLIAQAFTHPVHQAPPAGGQP